MLIKNILMPRKKLSVISAEDTLMHALQLLEQHDYLSLPVLQGNEFLGVLSRKYIFEVFFKTEESDRNAYLQRKVKELIKTKLPVVTEDTLIEQAAFILSTEKIQFLPVVNEQNEFVGIVTHKAIFSSFAKLFGLGDTRIVIETYDVKGRLAKMAEAISKAGGNISSIVQMATEVMDICELVVRIDADQPKKVVEKLKEAGFTIRQATYEQSK